MKVHREIEFFDQFEQNRGDYDVLGDHAYSRLLDLFEEFVTLSPDSRVADLGCGSGAFTRRLAVRVNASVTGMDVSPGLISRATKLGGREKYVIGDILQTDMPAESLDAILYTGVLHHFDSPELRVEVLAEGLRLLKPGGKMFAYDPSRHSPSMWLYRDPKSPLCSTEGKTENEVLLTRQQLASEAVAAGFLDVKVRGVSGITFTYVAGRLARLILPLYNVYELAVQYSPLENRIGTFLVTFGTKAV